MGLIHKIDAAIKLGISMELLESFIRRCPKPNQSVKLGTRKMADGEELIDEDELQKFRSYLNEPWPLPPSGGRPNIPAAIINDIKEESSYACAICGDLNNGEVAHIEAVASTYNNSPENLIFLCPNHHTAYDKGFKIGKNLKIAEVRAAKTMKRKNRRRMMRQEQNVSQTVAETLKIIKELHEKATVEPETLNEYVVTEAENLLKKLPEFIEKAEEQARKDQPADKMDQVILQNMPAISKLIRGVQASTDKHQISQMMAYVAEKTNDIIIELDEVECPHCHGSGQTGLVGDFCAYCRGSCYVTEKQAAEYNADLIDEVECPHCKGRGTTGLNGDLCRYCGGSCVVSEEKAEDYELDEMDEVECPRCYGKGTFGWNSEPCLFCRGSQTVSTAWAAKYDESDIDQQDCPHCNGKGTIGLNSSACAYCRGSCLVSSEDAERYDPDSLDQVNCPHCNGEGTIGLNLTACAYCHGDTVVTRQRYEEFNQNTLDEVECPHCHGRGTTGLNLTACAYCHGDTVVTRQRYEEFNQNTLDEVECPRCHGRGTTGLNGDQCKLCHGDMVVSSVKREAYFERYGDR
ncbi:hypothetical protein EEL31_18355 [Brevibacillus laterosporus]|nr:zinc finger domain-containing protein [Brevibacillus laterosporus]TPG70260.1 hypothetical protein EEL31_18355 [Brevibacillus laterosporus]